MEKVQCFRAAQDLQARAASTAAAPRQLGWEKHQEPLRAEASVPTLWHAWSCQGTFAPGAKGPPTGTVPLFCPRMPTADHPDHPSCPAMLRSVSKWQRMPMEGF